MTVSEIFAELKGRPLHEALEAVGRLVTPATESSVCDACGGSGQVARKKRGTITTAQARQLADDLIYEATHDG